MALESDYIVTAGIVQQFGEKDVYEDREVNETDVRSFTIKTITTQSLVRISLWDEMAGIEVGKGDLVGVDGKYSVSEDGQYHNVSASAISVRGETYVRLPNEKAKPAKKAKEKAEGTKAPF